MLNNVFKVTLHDLHLTTTTTTVFSFNPLKTSPEYTRAGVYGKCVL